jgi:hypothetical protein
MITNENQAFPPGKLGSEFSRIWAAIRALKPIPTPTVKVQETTRGVALHTTPPPAAARVQELTFLIQYDDILVCSNQSGAQVYVLKPPTLRASQWRGAKSWNFQSSNIFVGSPDNAYSYFTYERGLIYLTDHARWRVKQNKLGLPYMAAAVGVNGGSGSGAQYSYEVVPELIYPQYDAAQTNSSNSTNTQDLAKIYAIPTDSQFVTEQIVNSNGDEVVPAGVPVNLLDLNVDGRSWQPYTVIHHSLLKIRDGSTGQEYTVRLEQDQAADQMFTGAAGAFINNWGNPNVPDQ